MEEKKKQLVDLVIKRNVSAIITMSEKLGVEPDVVIELINELVTEGKLRGNITKDETRFFRSDAKVSDAPVIAREDKLPEFLSYNVRPGIAISIIGAIILVGGAVANANATDFTEQNFAAGLFLVGLLVMFFGLYLVAKRNPPD